MSEATGSNFLQTHVPYILLFVIVTISLLIVFSILGINFNPPANQELVKEVSFETDFSPFTPIKAENTV
jgi:hypothetical protein